MTLGKTSNVDWTSISGRSYNANTGGGGRREPKTLPRFVHSIIHIGIDSGCRRTRSKRADGRAKRTACRKRKNERKRERFKIESNLRKSWQHAESVVLRFCAPMDFAPFSLFSSTLSNPPREQSDSARCSTRAVWIIACSRNGHVR